MLPDGGQDGPGSATDVMPAFARGHLGEADGSMSTPSSPHLPPISTAGSLLNPPRGVGAGGHAARYMLSSYSEEKLNQAGEHILQYTDGGIEETFLKFVDRFSRL